MMISKWQKSFGLHGCNLQELKTIDLTLLTIQYILRDVIGGASIRYTQTYAESNA